MLRIGYMDYANVYPIFHYLLQDKNLAFLKGFPSELNKAMREGDIDISPSSSIEFARNHNLYKAVSNVCVSSAGAVKSVNIFSSFNIGDLDGKKIYWTKESNTSTVLCRIILEMFYNIKPVYTNNSDESEARLLIGDKALYEYYNSRDNVIDLGEEWYKFTGLPFVFALWIINRGALEHEYFDVFLENLYKYASLFPKDLAALAPRYIERGYTLEQLDDYWKTIVYPVSDNHKRGLSLFYKYAFELGETGDNGADFIDGAFI